jgi:hypothetical protein
MGQVAHDAVATSVDPVLTGGYASAAAPTDVTADGDAVRTWVLRNGAQATVVTAAGALIGGDATNGLDVDVTRLPALVAGSANIGDVDILTVPAPLSTTGGGTEATALRVTLANDSTGLVSIDDNGAALTVDNGGTFATQVDGAALTALQLIDNPVQVLGTDTYTEATSSGMTMGAVRRDADTTLVGTTNEFGPLQMDANGRLKVEIFAGGDTHPVSGTVTANIGTSGSLNLEATQADIRTAVQLIDNPVLVDDAAFAPTTSSVMMAGFQADETATDSVDEGDAGAARMTLDRKLIVTVAPHTAGGLTIFRSLDLDETEEDVKTAAGQVYGMWITNTATATRWIKFYNDTAANVIVGTTTPVITFGIPGNSSDDVSGLFGGANGIAFGTAICVAATTGVADADTGAPGANDVIVNIFYK